MVRNVFNLSVTISFKICTIVNLHIIHVNDLAAADQGNYK